MSPGPPVSRDARAHWSPTRRDQDHLGLSTLLGPSSQDLSGHRRPAPIKEK
ncbi:hypothetical protein H3H54_00440 [Brachybacterium sp. Z12]|uniref:hypothetical protein n=1 Tax=Brachybacterium sp. Z12 TaxID=2759167 RepID=UPI001862EA90|nr:hypothetical protein [Brachybacterium sp. Z12]QNN82544.1 hypothetical protein H3H54_00440 [Brachybacterium sp. Z12]